MSMDALTIDLGAETAVRVGDPAIVIGPGMPAERIAALTGTIAYEVTTSLSRRIERAELPPQGRAPHSRAE
jgi:alanine racemase